MIAPRALGHDRGIYYFLPHATGQVAPIAGGGLTKNTLLALAPIQFWESEFPQRGGCDWLAAANFLLRKCEDEGIFDPGRLVGRGVYVDKGRTVFHAGDKLVVDGQSLPDSVAVGVPGSRNFYQRGRSLPFDGLPPLGDAEAKQFAELLMTLDWSAPDMGKMLAGWLVIAPMCGALDWRPHLWLTGERGSGKSYVMGLAGEILGAMALKVQGATTEAGIRQDLNGDARPVLFDEADPKTESAIQRIAAILELARQASSSNSAPILKGGAGGKNVAYTIRSAFMFASINSAATLAADQSRIISLALRAPSERASADERQQRSVRFAELQANADRLLYGDFSQRLFVRSLDRVHQIRANAESFAVAIANRTGSRRLGDTVGAPIAGWCSLFTDRVLSAEEAAAKIDGWSWLGGALERGRTAADHDKALSHLLQSIVRGAHGHEHSVGELIDLALTGDGDHSKALKRRGLRAEPAGFADYDTASLFVAKGHRELAQLFGATPWATTWHETLAQHPAASSHPSPIRFAGDQSRSFRIDLSAVR